MKFPSDFLWGTAISAFQTEMGSSRESISDKSDWYVWVHDEENIREGIVSGDLPENGDGFWDFYKNDIENARWMGNNFIRLSLDWARIFPDETLSIDAEVKYEDDEIYDVRLKIESLNKMKSIADMDAVEHYKKIFEYIRSRGMKILLTLYHWPLPLWIHDPIKCHRDIESCGKKGWLDKDTIIEFTKFAYFSSREFSTYVNIWETINEPDVIASQGYVFGAFSGFPPAIFDMNKAFEVQKNLVIAHSLAYRGIKEFAKETPVGVGTAPQYFEPLSQDDETIHFVKYLRYLNNEWYLNGVNFGYLDMDLDGIFDRRLKNFSPPDYIGIDYYQRVKVKYKKIEGIPFIFNAEIEPCENCSDFNWDIYPKGIRIVLNDIFEKYRRPLYVLENGIADASDEKRQDFLVDHIREIEKVINIDHVPVKGYFHWSLIDNYEWAKGFSMRFGLYGVNYETKERYRRKSAELYRKICNNEF
ncbi:MAG: family 1 glycosylhydrolase [Euryarchaeota archaeon]|nr:family 1 glycosylhydrolase [Euryarchaeota archaeon]